MTPSGSQLRTSRARERHWARRCRPWWRSATASASLSAYLGCRGLRRVLANRGWRCGSPDSPRRTGDQPGLRTGAVAAQPGPVAGSGPHHGGRRRRMAARRRQRTGPGRALAAGLNDRPGDRWPAGEGLTRRESEVAELVARGMTNREIAARLYVSTRTVETHVDHILRKLDLSTRTQLVARAHEGGLLPRN
jgi:DNA-binding CsgD family transcriptional regulator